MHKYLFTVSRGNAGGLFTTVSWEADPVDYAKRNRVAHDKAGWEVISYRALAAEPVAYQPSNGIDPAITEAAKRAFATPPNYAKPKA